MPQPQQPGLLDLPLHLRAHILSFLAPEEQASSREWPPTSEQEWQQELEQRRKQQYVAALTAAKGLWQARDAVPFKTTLLVTTTKLDEARAAGHEWALLGLLARKAPMLTAAAQVAVDYEFDLTEVLRWLGGVQKLEVAFGEHRGGGAQSSSCFTIPETLLQLTRLTYLSIVHHAYGMDLSELEILSSLTALQSFKYVGTVDEPFQPRTFEALQQLTCLDLEACLTHDLEKSLQLTAEHLLACTGLRRLVLSWDLWDMEWPPVRLQLSLDEAPGALQQLEELVVVEPERACPDPAFWRVLPLLPRLKRLDACGVHGYGVCGPESAVLRECLPACQHLADVDLHMYSEPSLPQLPSSLTSLTLSMPTALRAVPLSSSIRRLSLKGCQGELLDAPVQLSGFTQLTSLSLVSCGLAEVPDWVAALPALEVLEMPDNKLDDLPELDCIDSLRRLVLYGGALQWVPGALEAALRLSYLNLAGHDLLEICEGSLRVLCSLPALRLLVVSCCEGVELEELTGAKTQESDYEYVGWSRLRGSLPGVQIVDLDPFDSWEYAEAVLEDIEHFGV